MTSPKPSEIMAPTSSSSPSPSSSSSSSPVQLLQCSVNFDESETGENHFRLLLDGQHIKYLAIAPNLFSIEDMCFEPALLTLRPPLPPASDPWTTARITKDPLTGIPAVTSTSSRPLPSCENVWHATRVEYLDLDIGEKLRCSVYAATCPEVPGKLIAKFAVWEWEIDAMDHEALAYSRLVGSGISPRFHGHILEHGRIIGFLIEDVQPAQHAGLEDWERCKAALGRLHHLGLVHGGVNRFNFLVTEDDGDGGDGDGEQRVVIIDIECARKTDRLQDFEEEMHSLLANLSSDLLVGGMEDVVDL